MSTIIYLSNQQIKIITGTMGSSKISLKDCYMLDAPEGTLINGIVMDPEAFGQFLMPFLTQNNISTKDVSLVVNSTNFFEKVIEMPTLSDKKTMDYIEREFVNIDRTKNPVSAYFSMSGVKEKKMRRLYIESVEVDFLQGYVDLFEGMGIKLNGIYSGLGSVIGLISHFIPQSGKTFLVQVVDGNNLTNILWVAGEYYYSSSSRLFHQPGTESFAADLGRSVSQILQFMQAHKIDSPLENVYLAGVDSESFSYCKSAIQVQSEQISVQMYHCPTGIETIHSEEFHFYLYAASGLYSNGKWHNFMLEYNKKRKLEKQPKKKINLGVFCVAGTLVTMVIALIVCFIMAQVKNKKLGELTAFNSSTSVLQQTEEYTSLTSENTRLNGQHAGLKEVCDNLDTYPIYSSIIQSIIENCSDGYADTTIEGFNATDGIVTFSAEAKNVKRINQFIRVLKEQDIFEQVDYSGYTYQDTTKLWDIHVTCVLSQDAGR